MKKRFLEDIFDFLPFHKKVRGFERQLFLDNFEQNFYFFFKMDKKFIKYLELYKKNTVAIFFLQNVWNHE